MASNNNNNIVVNITGNSQGLTTAVNQAQTSLGNLRSAAQGNLKSITSSMAGMSGAAAVSFAGATAVLAGFTFALKSTADATRQAMELMQLTAKSNMSAEGLQQMANMYRQTGLTMDNISDQQKDIKDKIADGLTNAGGSMYTDVIQPLKLNLIQLQQMADAGEDVYAKIYFAAKAQGFSNSQLINMFETMGNDATSRLQVLKDYNTEQEYNIALGNQTVTMTSEQIQKFAAYDKATNDLALSWQKWKNEIATGTVPVLTQVVNLLARITSFKAGGGMSNVNTQMEALDYTIKQYEQTRKNWKDAGGWGEYGEEGYQKLLQQRKDLQKQIDWEKKSQQGYEENKGNIKQNLPSNSGAINSVVDQLGGKVEKAQKQVTHLKMLRDSAIQAIQQSDAKEYATAQQKEKAIAEVNRRYNERLQEQNDIINDKAGKDKAAKAAESAATKQAALDKKNADARKKAQLDLSTTLSKIGETEMQRQLNAFDFQQKEMQRKIAENAKLLGRSQAEIDKYLAQAKEQGARQRTELINKQIGYNDPNQGLKNLNANLNGVTLNDQQKNYLGQQQAQRVYGDNPFAVDNTQSKQQQLEDQYNQEMALNERLYAGTEEYEKRKAALQAKYAQDSMNTATENTRAQLTLLGNAAGDIGGMMAGAFVEQSAAAKAAFAVQKGLIISETILRIQAALASALATPFPASLGAYAQIAGMGMQIISTIKGASSGQFHGGVDQVPRHLDNKSFVLQQGERVVQAPANQKLTKFLDKQDQSSGNSSTGEITINAPLVVQGGINDDKMFNDYLKRHANNVNQAVRSAQSRNA
ncbi:hypothetical protein PTR64_01200 [Serratia nevei]|uniref:hypothetical protein n=2 Tax=Serratia TaxID=613 RepID=UPI00313AE881